MLNDAQKNFLAKAAAAATAARHPFPEMTACEAALESHWGLSQLAQNAHNLFGMKQHRHPKYGTMNLPTREFVGVEKEKAAIAAGQPNDGTLDGWITVSSHWVEYPDWASCFADRLATLQRLSNALPHYKAALEAVDPITYVTEVSKSWSTDPARAEKVISIFNESIS